jgi:hypothetical protein
MLLYVEFHIKELMWRRGLCGDVFGKGRFEGETEVLIST